MTKAIDLIKESTQKHKGIFFYINKNKKLGRKPTPKSAKEKVKVMRTIKKARLKAKARGRG